MPRPGALGLPHHTDALFSFLALGVGPPHLSQGTDAEVDILRGSDAVVRQEQAGEENAVTDLESIVLEERSAEVLLDDRADSANQVMALGLSDGVQALDDSAVIVTGSFE
jgi:hypothetical protein